MGKRASASSSSTHAPAPSTEVLKEISQHGTRTGLAATLTVLKTKGWLKDEVADEAGEEQTTRKKLKAAMEEHSQVQTPYGRVVQTMQLAPGLTWEFCNPLCLLYHLSCISAPFASLMRSITTEFVPLRVVLYIDACEPGDPLRPDNNRKVECLYWTFAEFPQWLLQRSGAWFVFGYIRSKVVAEKLRGGTSELMARVIKAFFEPNIDGHCFGRGVDLVYEETRYKVTAKLGGILADDDAHTYAQGLKGATGRHRLDRSIRREWISRIMNQTESVLSHAVF